jgi:hypothetical protein
MGFLRNSYQIWTLKQEFLPKIQLEPTYRAGFYDTLSVNPTRAVLLPTLYREERTGDSRSDERRVRWDQEGTTMSEMQVEVQGTLDADGTLRLDEKPGLPAGRVTVVLRAAPALPPGAPTGLLERMERGRKQLEDSGHRFLTEEEMAERIREIKGEDDEDAWERAMRTMRES